MLRSWYAVHVQHLEEIHHWKRISNSTIFIKEKQELKLCVENVITINMYVCIVYVYNSLAYGDAFGGVLYMQWDECILV